MNFKYFQANSDKAVLQTPEGTLSWNQAMVDSDWVDMGDQPFLLPQGMMNVFTSNEAGVQLLVPAYSTRNLSLDRKVWQLDRSYMVGPRITEDRRGTKDSNPKDAIGVRKAPLSVIPFRVLWGVGLAMLDGALKYGRFNYRSAGVRASIYFDAALRHIGMWWEGEDETTDSKVHHLDHAIACLMVLRDSMIHGNWDDDRPPSKPQDMAAVNAKVEALLAQHADKHPHHYTNKDQT